MQPTACPGSETWPGVVTHVPETVGGGRYLHDVAWDVVDLFSGGGGASFGFHAFPGFRLVGAADAQVGKPSAGLGSLGCNTTYSINMGLSPVEADLAQVSGRDLRRQLQVERDPTVLIACPPCTGFSRTLAHNHIRDDVRNSLIGRTAEFVAELRPEILFMENAREMLTGRFSLHFQRLKARLREFGYRVTSRTHILSSYGLPQRRERALVVAVRSPLPLMTLDDLWAGHRVNPKATHVRRALWEMPPIAAGEQHPEDVAHRAPAFNTQPGRLRLAAIPPDGGSWADLIQRSDRDVLMTPAMKHRAAIGDFGSHPDVYGRMWWDRPAPTLKRECSHPGNGRYSHPEQDRLCSVREMALLNGFPKDYQFGGSSLSNMYRHVGDAVPPLISYQMAALAKWILTGNRPRPAEYLLPNTHLSPEDVEPLTMP